MKDAKKMQKVTVPKNGRRTGRTTRLIDYYIQELFTRGEVEPQDHFNAVGNAKLRKELNLQIVHIIVSRLRNEHGRIKYEMTNKDGRCGIKLCDFNKNPIS